MGSKLRILFVEDILRDAELIWHEIKKSDIAFEKLLVDSKKDFLEGLRSFNPDLIISDYSLPQFDGMTALHLRNELAPLIPFILVTGSLNEEVAVNCMKAGADDYILKDNLSRLGLAITNSIKKAKLLKEKKVTEEELLKSELRLKKAQSIAHVGNWELFLSTKIMWSSEEAMKIYGLFNASHEFPMRLIEKIPLPEYRGILNEALDNLLKYNEPYEVEFKIKRANDGAVRSVYSKAELVLESDEEQVKVIGVLQDITERKQMEEAIYENEEIFRNFMEYSPIYVFFKDENIKPIRLSKNYEKMLGKPLEDILGKDMFELFPSELAKSMVADDKKILKEGKEIIIEEELNGRYYTTIKFPILIEGIPRYLAGYTIDITDNKLAEIALHENEEKYRRIFENVQDLYYETSITGTILEISPSVELVSKGQYKRDDLIGKSMYDFYPDSSERDELILKLKKRGTISDFEINLKNKDGSHVPCSVSSKICLDAYGHP
jgi:PAS domain S-box-containing protein